MSSLAQARAAKARVAAELAERGDRAGVGLAGSDGDYCVKVNVPDPAAAARLPASMDGVEVRVAVVGPVRAET